MEDLEEMLLVNDNDGIILANADVEVQVKKDESEEEKPEMTKEEYATKLKKEAMEKLGVFEELENRKTILSGDLAKATQDLEMLFSRVRAQNRELVDKIKQLEDELATTSATQDKVREELLPIQQDLYNTDNKEKTLIYNKIQSTFVAPTEKNQFDLKKFREEQNDFWKEHYNLLKDYAKITDVASYLKITIKK